ncbi:hypothetical protein EIP86_004481 [Pleurotus ostreatoroseus]|nr:hypothetical protein EIP86_004481 [Pleurotus ostreatoroseus]
MFLRTALYDIRTCSSRTLLVRNALHTRRAISRTARAPSDSPIAPGKPHKTTFELLNPPSSRTSRSKLRLQDAKFDTLLWKLQLGLTEQDLPKIRETYLAFIQDEREAQPVVYNPRLRQKEILLLTLDTLADAGQLDMLDVVLDLMQSRCGMVIDREVHQNIVRRLLEAERLSDVFTWLTQMRHKPGNIAPTPHMWTSFIRICRRNQVPGEFFRKPVACVRMSGCEPDAQTYQAILEAMFGEQSFIPEMDDVKDVLEEMDKVGCLTRTVLDGLVHTYSKARVYDAISHLEDILRRKGEDFLPQDTRVNNHLAEKVLAGLDKEAYKSARDFVRRGFVPTVSTLAVVSPTIVSMRTLTAWEGLLGVQANREVWENIIENAPDPRTAMDLYNICIDRGHAPTVPMLLPILHNLVSVKWGSPSPAKVEKALTLLRQYVDITTRNPRRRVNNQRDLPLYNVVLRAVVQSAKTPEQFAIATSLLDEIKARDIATDYITRTSFIVLSMQCASTPQEAFDLFNKMKRQKDDTPALDSKGYTAVLGCFTKNFLKTPAEFPLCMNILYDMRKAGRTMTVETFSIVLRQLAVLAKELPPEDVEKHQQVVDSIRRIHNHISIEASFKPDVVLWNQLMDTYQRAGCFREAYKVWESMFISREFDYASVSIIWDACAYAGAYDYAKDIFIKLQRVRFIFNERNWRNWVECLCRLGKIEDATKVICLQMPEEAKMKPSQDLVKLLLQFASKHNEEGLVVDRVRRYLPDVYAKLR